MLRLRNEYSRALGVPMTYSDKATEAFMNNRPNMCCRTWVRTGIDADIAKTIFDKFGLSYVAISSNYRYLRVYTIEA